MKIASLSPSQWHPMVWHQVWKSRAWKMSKFFWVAVHDKFLNGEHYSSEGGLTSVLPHVWNLWGICMTSLSALLLCFGDMPSFSLHILSTMDLSQLHWIIIVNMVLPQVQESAMNSLKLYLCHDLLGHFG